MWHIEICRRGERTIRVWGGFREVENANRSAKAIREGTWLSWVASGARVEVVWEGEVS